MATYQAVSAATKAKLANLSCPFTWDILQACLQHKSTRTFNNDDESNIETSEDSSLLLQRFIIILMNSFVTLMGNDLAMSKQKLTEAEQLMVQFKEKKDAQQFIKVIEHIFYSTKCHFLYETYETENLDDILKMIVDVKDFNRIEMSTLYGCQSVAWSTCHDFGMERAIELANRALSLDASYGLWHFVVAKNMRRKRRAVHVHSVPDAVEKNHFAIAYQKSKNPFFGIYYAQACREELYGKRKGRFPQGREQEEKKLLDLYKDIIDLKPISGSVFLKLALGFIRLSEFDSTKLVKTCLDEAEKRNPEKGTFFHYKGLFCEQIGEYQDALKCFKQAAEYNNFSAELSYIQYGWETGEDSLDPLAYSLGMLIKYKDAVAERQQTMLLNTAIAYYVLRKDTKNAAEYFLKAIKADPQSKKLKTFFRFLNFDTHLYPNGIYGFLEKEFLPKATAEGIEEVAFKETCKRIKELCRANQGAFMNKTMNRFQRWQI